MQNVAQGSSSDSQKIEKGNAHHDTEKSSTPQSSNSSPTKSGTETFSELQPKFMTDSSESEEDDVSEVESFMIEQELDDDSRLDTSKFLLSGGCSEGSENSVDPETQARLEALLEAAGISKLSTGDGKQLSDPEVLRRLTSSVSCALDEAAAALTRMRTENPRPQVELVPTRSLVEACTDGDVSTVRKLLTEGKSVHETTEEGESLLSLACSAGYLELAQVLLAMHANVEDRGVKGDCTPLMEAASAGHPDIVKLLINHGAEVNAQSCSGNTPLMYACSGGHEAVVRVLLENEANVEDHNENGHTPLMEAASAGHVGVAKILLDHGAGINTHSNEFKESALTLACYKGHLDMVRFLLEAGADQEHKTDEMHTALMEASMDGHVEVARLLLDSGAQVNMPTDSFESPLTLAACGGHTELAMLLIERGANIEEVNDEGYTPLMEAAREGHEEMVALLLSQGANINAQTEETQETALTLACCGGFLEVADFLLKAGADLELGASTPLMEAAQEGHLELVRYLLEYYHANVNAQTQTGDTALTYACENGHTEVATLLLMYGAELEHESEGGRTPLMKACRAGHQQTVQFLISKNADVNKTTTNNDHTPLSLAAAGGHIGVVELLLAHHADPFHKLKDNSTILIEAAKGGHTKVVHLLLDYPHSIMMQPPAVPPQPSEDLLREYDAARAAAAAAIAREAEQSGQNNKVPLQCVNKPHNSQKPLSLLRKIKIPSTSESGLTSVESQQVRTQPVGENNSNLNHSMSECDYNIQDKGSGSSPATKGEGEKKDVTVSTATLVPGPKPLGLNIDLSPPQTLSKVVVPAQPSSPPQPPQQSLLNSPPQQPFEVSQNTAISDRPKAKPVSKKEGKNIRKLNIQQQQLELQQLTQQEFQQTQMQNQSQALQTPTSQVQDRITPSQLLAHLQQLDPAIAAAATPTQLQLLQQKHQQLWTLQQQIAPANSVDVNELADSLLIAAITSSQDGTDSKEEGKQLSKTPAEQIDNIVMDFAHKLEAFRLEDPAGEPERLTSQEQQELSAEEALAAEEEAFSLLAQQQSQDLTYITVPAIASQQAQRGNQTGQLQYHQFTNPHDIISQKDVPSGLQMTSTPLQLPGANGQAITLTRTNEGAVQISGGGSQSQISGTNSRQMDLFSAGFVAGLQSVNKARISSGNLPASSNVQQSAQNIQVANGITPLHMGNTAATHLMNLSTRIDSGNTTFQTQPLFPPPLTLPSRTVTTSESSTSTAHFSCPITTEANTTRQVQVATQTVTEKKVSHLQSGYMKGKKARFQIQPRQHNPNFTSQNSYQIDPNSGIGQYPLPNNGTQCQQQTTPPVPHPPLQLSSGMDVDSETDSNHDTALTLACAGGHEELVELLLSRGADIEHRDKKGFTPLILAATAGHEKVVDILLNHGADIEAQSERTKDTPLSLACSGGRYEVVELLLTKMANKEHRNVSDYTPLSLAASGGYVNIIKLLLSHGAEINSRTGSKLGISPLMLAAMNGHTTAVRLLLDMGSDINAQIETNRNTALTLACFQGRHEVVSLLLDRKANVEHRAKTGLTPLMEAASGGYVEVGRVLLDKGADVNAPPVPSSRDTALTIAADKGHCRFVELLLSRNAMVEVKNKKGNSPLWLAANGGHLNVVELLYNLDADIDSQDNRKVSCLMAAFRKGHVKVVKWMVNHVTQFPSDQDMTRFIATVNDKELLEKCHECVKLIRAAKDLQSAKANKNASILLEELDMEKNREESKKAAAARRRERKKKKKLEKKEEKRKLINENKKNERIESDNDEEAERSDVEEVPPKVTYTKEKELSKDSRSNDVRLNSSSPLRNGEVIDKEEGDSGIDANSQGSCSSNDVKSKEKRKEKKKKRGVQAEREKANSNSSEPSPSNSENTNSAAHSKANSGTKDAPEGRNKGDPVNSQEVTSNNSIQSAPQSENKVTAATNNRTSEKKSNKNCLVFESSRHPADREDFEATGSETYVPGNKSRKSNNFGNHFEAETVNSSKNQGSSTSPKGSGKREEGWKEVVRNFPYKSKKVSVPLNAISRVIGRGGSNINAIRSATGAHIEVEKQGKGQGERIITIKGSGDATKQAHNLIAVLIKDPDVDILQMLPKQTKPTTTATPTTAADKITVSVAAKPKHTLPKLLPRVGTQVSVVSKTNVTPSTSVRSTTASKIVYSTTVSKSTAPRLVSVGEKRNTGASQVVPNTKTTMSYTSAIMTSGRNMKVTPVASQTFAAKLNDSNAPAAVNMNNVIVGKSRTPIGTGTILGTSQAPATAPVSPQVSPQQQVLSSPKHLRPQQTVSAPPNVQGQFPTIAPFPQTTSVQPMSLMQQTTVRSSTPVQHEIISQNHIPQEYSLFNDSFSKSSMWGRENEQNHKLNFASVAATGGLAAAPPTNMSKFMEDIQTQTQVDITKAPGYRGNAVCSPVSSKSSNNTQVMYSVSGGFPEQPAPSLTVPNIRPSIDVMNTNIGPMPPTQHVDIVPTPGAGPGPIGPPLFASRPNYQSTDKNDQPLYTNVNSPSFGQDLLKINPDNQIIGFTQLNYSQQNSPPAPTTNPTVSMSRLNPRAPDFSISYAKQPQHQQQQIFHPQSNNPNMTVLTLATTLNKQYPRSAASNGHPRWPYGPIPQGYQPQLQEVAGIFTNHNVLPNSVELLTNFENDGVVNSPSMSPPSLANNPTGDHKIEDRKIPRPIGTERNWKNSQGHNATYGVGPSGDMDPANWLVEPKINWPGARNINPVFAGNPTPYRIPLPEELPQLIDSPYQQPGLVDGQFSNGNSATLAQQLILASQVPQLDPTKLDQPGWETTRLGIGDLSDSKQHGWTTKWNH
ncbi:hypothetical protein RUM44_010324 [Polyplax serrata]|uniref:K Homology domain-containing protein n=1 Tax=Polyplax serrata TaxID=468196 RepID=A0ABR1AVA6_POLSC